MKTVNNLIFVYKNVDFLTKMMLTISMSIFGFMLVGFSLFVMEVIRVLFFS